MKIVTLKREQIAKIIESGDIEGFLGAVETSFFEFREKPYFPNNEHDTVSREKSRLELLKDFSSIANSGGGYIIIGLIPGEDVSQFNLEYVKEVKGIEAEKINLKGWLDILSTYLIPRFEENFIKHGIIGQDKQLLWVQIPAAKDIGCYPFMIAKDQWVTEDEKLLKGELYGLYFRDGSKNRQMFSAEKFQEKMAETLGSKETSNKAHYTVLEAKLDRLLALQENPVPIKTVDPEVKKKEIIKNFDNKLDSESDFFYMIAIPTQEFSIDNFWDTDEDKLYNLLRKPPTLRNMGWDLSVHYTEFPKPAGDNWEIMNGNRKILSVNKSGIVATAGTLQEFLDWGTHHRDEAVKPIINAFALVEYIDVYCHFLKVFTNLFVNPETEYTIIVGFRIRTGQKFQLCFTVGFLPKTPPDTLQKFEWCFDGVGSNRIAEPTALAAYIAREIYAGGFSYVTDSPEYMRKDNGKWVIDEDLYKKQ